MWYLFSSQALDLIISNTDLPQKVLNNTRRFRSRMVDAGFKLSVSQSVYVHSNILRSNILWSLLLKWKIKHRIELLKITKLEVWKDLCLLIYVCWFFSYSHKTVTNFVVFVGYRGTLITLSVLSCWEMPDLPIHLLMKCSVRIDYTPQFIFVVIFSAYCLNFLNTLSVTF